MTVYDNKGAMLWRGYVQFVEDMLYETTGTGATEAPIPVPASSISNGLAVDCSTAQFEWLDTRTEYTE